MSCCEVEDVRWCTDGDGARLEWDAAAWLLQVVRESGFGCGGESNRVWGGSQPIEKL